MNSSTKKIRQLIDICDELDMELLSYTAKRLRKDWDDLIYIAIIERPDKRVQTMIYDNELEAWR